MTPKTFPAVSLPPEDAVAAPKRAIIEFDGLDQSGPSFEGRVFLNNPTAGPDTERTPEQGYAGCFHIYSYGMPAAPQIAGTERTAVLPMTRRLIATDAVRLAASRGPLADVTLVPVIQGGGAQEPAQPDPVTVSSVRITTDDGGVDTAAASY